MKKLRVQKNEGFTLIELLVVIAIIGLLSSVVLTSLDSARMKGRNSRKNSIVLQYINALELWKSDDSSDEYPNFGWTYGSYPTQMYCLGEGQSDTCLGFWSIINPGYFVGLPSWVNQTFNNNYIPGPPKDDTPMMYGSHDYSGIAYSCYRENITDLCSEYQLWWYLESDAECPRGADSTQFFTFTYCKYSSKPE